MSDAMMAAEVATHNPFTPPNPKGPLSWIATVDHKQVGILYLWFAVVFLAIGGLEALLMRVQLAWPGLDILSPRQFNQTFTMHGTTMIFFVVMPIVTGYANYFLPLMIGARDVAFPRLNAFGFWMLLFGAMVLYFSLCEEGGAPDAGWFGYAPLTAKPYNSLHGIDYWALGLLISGVGSVAAALNLIVTTFLMRAPGMRIWDVPLFVWMSLITAFLIIFAFPALNAGLVMLLVDRFLNAQFFQGQGDPLLWQHYFWAFGHPEVYIMVLPAFGMVSEVIPVFSRKPIFGYAFLAGSTLAIGILSYLVWIHHMFAVGLGLGALLAFSASSMLIAVPTGVKIFNWIGTMWGGRIRFTTAMLFAVAFILQFTVGGVSGVTLAMVPIDWAVTDSYYVVAHFHYVALGGILFAIFSGTYYWFPKMSGRMLDETLGKWNFWTLVLGFNLTFLIQHFLGLMGMPRRVYTYPDWPLWGAFNLISTVGAFVMALSVAIFLLNLVVSLRRGRLAGDDPWDAWTLEWMTTSPPPHHNFDRVPYIRSRRPLWDLKNPDRADWKGGGHGG